MGKLGSEIADMVGPPDSKSKKYPKPDAEDAADGGDDEAAEGEDDGSQEDAELSAMEEFEGAGDAKAKLEAFKKLLDICGG